MFYTYIWHICKADKWTPIYVGKGKGCRSHVHLKAKTHVGRALRKYPNFVVVIEHDQDEKQAHADEIALIAHYGRADLGKGPLVNLTDGGEGPSGMVLSPEHRLKISESNKSRIYSSETRRRIGESSRGREYSDEHRKKMSAAQAGKTLSAEQRRKISESNKGRKLSAEHRLKLSEARKRSCK